MSLRIKLICCHCGDLPIQIVASALDRSFTKGQVHVVQRVLDASEEGGLIILHPGDEWLDVLENALAGGVKILLLGRIGKQIADKLGLEVFTQGNFEEWSVIGNNGGYDSAFTCVKYNHDNPLCRSWGIANRYLSRYDFEREWNNHGYGRITTDNGVWSICQRVGAEEATIIARIENKGGELLSVYASLMDFPRGSVLWFNRAVGPVDSLEWRIVESFFSEYR